MTGEEPLRWTWRAHALQTKGSAEAPAGRAAALPRPARAPGLSGCSDREETTEHGGHRRASPAGVTTARAWTPAPRSVQAASGGRAHLPGPARGPSRLKTAAPPQPLESSRARPRHRPRSGGRRWLTDALLGCSVSHPWGQLNGLAWTRRASTSLPHGRLRKAASDH